MIFELMDIENKLKIYRKDNTLTRDKQERLMIAHSYVEGTLDAIHKRRQEAVTQSVYDMRNN